MMSVDAGCDVVSSGLWLAGKCDNKTGRDAAVVADKTTVRVFSIDGHQQLTEVHTTASYYILRES